MHLALTDLFNARWTDKIHEEWIRNVLENREDLTRAQLERTRDLMDQSVRDPKVYDFEDLEGRFSDLPDKDDAHVIAAAVKSNSDAIITYNLKDFPSRVLDQYHIEAIHPDDFIQFQIDLNSGKVCEAIKRHRNSLRNPPKTVEEYLSCLKKQGLPQTVQTLEGYSALI